MQKLKIILNMEKKTRLKKTLPKINELSLSTFFNFLFILLETCYSRISLYLLLINPTTINAIIEMNINKNIMLQFEMNYFSMARALRRLIRV